MRGNTMKMTLDKSFNLTLEDVTEKEAEYIENRIISYWFIYSSSRKEVINGKECFVLDLWWETPTPFKNKNVFFEKIQTWYKEIHNER